MLTAVNPPGMPPNPAYSQGMSAANVSQTLYISGQVGVGPHGTVPDGIGEQTRNAIANLGAVLEAAGMDVTNIAKMTIYLTDEASIPGFMEAGGGALPNPPPATTLLIVKALAMPNLLVEIEAIAVK